MKNLIVILFAFVSLVASAESDSRMQQALTDCQEGNYAEAIVTYETILSEGRESATLYYNLGYAYYKSGKLGKAILNLERSKKLNSSDPDVIANLEQAYSLTDQMQTIEPLFLVRWWRSFSNLMSSDGWAWAFVILFIVFLVGVGGFLFTDSVFTRKFGFFSALVTFVLAIIAITVSANKRGDITDSQEAIIMSASVTMTTSPDKNGSEMAVLHEGTHVDILSELGEWIEVQLKDGNVGWLKKESVEVI